MRGIFRGGDGRPTLPAAVAAAGGARPAAATTPARRLTASDAAWLAAIPTAAIAVLAILLLGPPLGHALLAPGHARFWDIFQEEVRPEPVEHGRFLIAVAVPLVLAGLTVALARRGRWRASPASDVLIVAAEAAAVAFALACLLQQHALFGPLYPPGPLTPRAIDYFPGATLPVAAAATIAVLAAISSARVRTAFAGLTRETRTRAIVAFCLALAAIAVWLLPGVNTEHTIRAANFEILYHTQFTLDETYAVLDHRSPLVDFASQYGSLWPYAFAAAMSLLGTTVGVWITLALVTTGLGMLSIFAVLRRAAHSSIGGLLLFLPLLAVSFFTIGGTSVNRYSYGNYFGAFPMRYAGPSILAWLVARQLGGGKPRRAWLLFLLAGVVALNNADVGAAAVGATAAALLWGERQLTRARAGRLALEGVAGLAGAYALVSLLTLVRAGALPHLGLLLRFSHLFAVEGFGMFPMPTLGLHIAIYLTFVAALGVATVRALRGEPDRLLTGMLAWSGVFGLGAGAYFVGRSTPDDLPATFFPWAFTLALLLIPALGALRRATWRRPPLAAVACLFAFLLTACSLARTPTPWGQLDRLQHTVAPILATPHGKAFVAQHVHRGERVVILGLLGHRIGLDVGVVNVSPYANSLSMATVEQLDETVAALRAAGGSKVFVDLTLDEGASLQHALEADGFRYTATGPSGETGLWVDTHAR